MIAKLLIGMGADVNRQSGEYGNALQASAARTDMKSIVELLLENGADVNALGGEYGTALAAAARIGNVKALELLLKAGANVNAHGEEVTALVAAIENGERHAVSALLDAGADVHYPWVNDETPLRVAIRLQNEKIVLQLWDIGAFDDGVSIDTLPKGELDCVTRVRLRARRNQRAELLLHQNSAFSLPAQELPLGP